MKVSDVWAPSFPNGCTVAKDCPNGVQNRLAHSCFVPKVTGILIA